VSLDEDARAELEALARASRLRVPRILDGRHGRQVTVDGVVVTCFASNDYLGLAGDARLADVAAAALHEHGVGAGASRLIVGNQRAHEDLESEVEDWMRCGGARLFNSGYAANVGVMTTLLRAGDVVFSDALNHASIIDGCRLSRADVVVYPHGDLVELERALIARVGRRRIVVSESIFSMDGDIVDVAALAELCRQHGAALVLDEAHAIGVTGPEGRGVAAACAVVPDVVIGTFGKALGTFGAFAASSRAVADLLWNRARSLVFSTGLPACIPAATRAALAIVRGSEGDDRRSRVAARSRELRFLVPALGGGDGVPIAPLVIGEDHRTMERGADLLRQHVLVATVRPPTVPAGTARLRISLSAAHEPADVTRLGQLLVDDAKRQGSKSHDRA
jgi:8-amino-7-oxononanoate synthase